MIRQALFATAALLAASAAQAAAPPPGIAGVGVQKTIYGEAYTDPRGLTLYVRGTDGACAADCQQGFTPFAAARIAKPTGDWTIVQRPDGGRQWAYQGKALYTSSRDFRAGDANGDGVAGWQALLPQRNFVPAEVVVRPTDFGPTFTVADTAMTLYMPIRYRWNAAEDVSSRHRGDGPGPEACGLECLKEWKPLKAPDNAQPAGDWTIVTAADGTRQWAWKTHPLYTRVTDKKPGDITGEGNWTLDGVEGSFWEVANLK